MLNIILLIIKVFALILLVLLCTLLFLVLVILLVPVRYHVYIEHGEKFYIRGTFSWLLHILHGNFDRKTSKFHIKVRLFGFVLYDNARVKTHKRPVRNRSRFNIRRKEKTTQFRKTTEEIKQDVEIDFDKKKNERIDKAANKDANIKETTSEKTIIKEVTDTETNIDETNIDVANIDEANIDETNIDETNIDEATDTETNIDETNARETYIKEVNIEETDIADNKFIRNKNSEKKKDRKNNNQENKQIDVDRLKSDKEEDAQSKKTIFTRLLDKVKKWINNILDLKRKINLLVDFIKDDINKQGFHLTFYSIRNLLKHILPRRLKSRLIFGTGDPCSTGQILGILGILYGIYGESINIEADFENIRFEGEHDIKGRIRIGTILIIIIKLVLDKRFKEFKRNIKTLKEAL